MGVIIDDRPEKCLCQSCGRPFAGVRTTSYTDKLRDVGRGAAAPIPEDLKALIGVDGRGPHISTSVQAECTRCVATARFRDVRKTPHRSRDLHRDFLVGLGRLLAETDDPLTTLEAHHVGRLLVDFPGPGQWLSLDALMAHPSYPHIGHLIGALPIGHNPKAKLNIGDIAYVSQDGLGVSCLAGVVSRLENEDLGECSLEVRSANAQALETGDGVVRGVYSLAPMQARQGQGRTILRARAYICLYADGTRPTTTIVFAVEPTYETPTGPHHHEPQRIGRTS
jgi:hypothetical protein